MLFYHFANFLYQFGLCTIGISVVLVGNVAVAVNNKCERNCLNTECTAEVAVWVEQYLVRPSVRIYQWLHLIYILSLVY